MKVGWRPTQTFSQRHTDDQQVHKKMLSVIREMQIKQQWGIISVKMAIIEKTRDNKCWWECGERESLGYSREVSPEIKGRTNMTQQFHFWEENETNNLKTYMYSNSYGQIIYNSQDMKKP